MIELRDVKKVYGQGAGAVEALASMSLLVERGKILCVRGPSGSGKTTLLSLCGLLLEPTEGEVVFGGRAVSGMTAREKAALRAERIGFVFQEASMLEGLSVWENAALPLLLKGNSSGARGKAAAILREAGLEDKMNTRPPALSVGQRKRVEVARALISSPELVIADEPTAGLDTAAADVVMDLLRRGSGQGGRTVIFATHDARLASFAHVTIEIRDGRIC